MAKKNDFDALLDELSSLESTDELAKAMPVEDPEMEEDELEENEKIKAASEDGDAVPADEDDAEYMGKSMTVKIDGEDVEAFDGMELIKSFTNRLDGSEKMLRKALEATVKTIKSRDGIIKKQGELLKSLQEQVAVIGNTGKGRKAVVNVHDKQTGELKKSDGVSPGEFRQLLKSAVASGAVNAMDAGRAETALNNGQAVPEVIIAKVAANK